MKFWGVFWLALCLAVGVQAHELRPAIADLETRDGQVHLLFRLSAEPLLTGADLEGVDDTNATSKSAEIDALRALPVAELLPLIEAQFSDVFGAVQIAADGAPLTLSLSQVSVEDEPDLSLPRESQLWVQAPLPAEARTLVVQWPASYGALILRQNGVDAPYSGYLTGQASDPIAIDGGSEAGFWGALAGYVPVGFDHIVPKGLDHILFVLGLFFLSTQLGPLLWQVSAFTLAHTVTLALGALGWIAVPGNIVEPIIAASIVYVAVENIRSDQMNRWRPLVVFGFGLLHGLGFASVLGEFGLPQGQFIAALLGFNIGVEIGQLAVIATVFVFVWLVGQVAEVRVSHRLAVMFYGAVFVVCVSGAVAMARGMLPVFADGAGVSILGFTASLALFCAMACRVPADEGAYRRFVAVPASVVIAAIAAYWVIERVFL